MNENKNNTEGEENMESLNELIEAGGIILGDGIQDALARARANASATFAKKKAKVDPSLHEKLEHMCLRKALVKEFRKPVQELVRPSLLDMGKQGAVNFGVQLVGFGLLLGGTKLYSAYKGSSQTTGESPFAGESVGFEATGRPGKRGKVNMEAVI